MDVLWEAFLSFSFVLVDPNPSPAPNRCRGSLLCSVRTRRRVVKQSGGPVGTTPHGKGNECREVRTESTSRVRSLGGERPAYCHPPPLSNERFVHQTVLFGMYFFGVS